MNSANALFEWRRQKRFQTGSTGGLLGIMSRMLNRKTSGIMSRMLDRKTSGIMSRMLNRKTSGIMSRMLNRKTSGIMSRMLDRKTSKAGRTNFHNQGLTEKETNDISKKDEGCGSWIC